MNPQTLDLLADRVADRQAPRRRARSTTDLLMTSPRGEETRTTAGKSLPGSAVWRGPAVVAVAAGRAEPSKPNERKAR